MQAGTGFRRQGIIAESPRNRSCTAASRLAVAIPGIAYGSPDVGGWQALRAEARTADGNGGVSQRIKYGSVGCVLPVASQGLSPSCRAGSVFGGDRRFSLPGFCKIPPRLLSASPCTTWQPPWRHYAFSHHHAFRRHYATRYYRHLARASRWDAGVAQMQARGLADSQCQPCVEHFSGAGMSSRIRFIRASSPKRAAISAATPPAAAACGARGS